MHLVYPPPPENFHNRCFQFLLGIAVVSREIQDNGYAIFFGGGGGGGERRCIMVYVKIVNCGRWLLFRIMT